LKPNLQILRRRRRPLLRGLEQPRRSTLADHVHRPSQLGPWVLINESWYKDAQRGVGASSRNRFSVFSARQSPAGSFAPIIAAFRLTSLARCAPGMTLTTAGWPSGKRSAASGNPTLKLLQICWILRTRSLTSSGTGP